MQTSLLSGRALILWRAGLIFFLILIIARFLVVGQAKILFNTVSSDGDEAAYLSFGLALLEDGTLTDGARPPLYPLLLSTIAEREWTYFTRAKMLTLGLGVMAIIATFAVGTSLFSWEVGLLAAFLLAANKEFHVRASTIYTDVLFVSIFLGSWYFLIKSFKGWGYCILAGIFTGLAYLSKGSGPILIGTWGLVALFYYGREIFKHKELLLVPLFFVIMAAPLLLYNAQHFGDPLYSLTTTHVLWMESWDQTQVSNPADMPTMSTYFQTHTVADIVERIQFGFLRLTAFMPHVIIPSRTIEPDWLLPLLGGITLLIGAAVFIWRRNWVFDFYRQHHLTLNLGLMLFATFYLLLSWYARLQVESRFILPLLPLLYTLLSAVIVALLHRLGLGAAKARTKGVWPWRAYIATLAIFMLWAASWLIQTALAERWSLTVDPFSSDQQANMEVDEVLKWLAADHPQGEVPVIFGPAKTLPLWKFPPRFDFTRIPIDMDTWPLLENYIASMSPEYIIIDSDTARRRRQALSEHFGYEQGVGVTIEQIPADWALIYIHNETPHRWVIFEPFETPATPLAANFANQIKLLGYELISSGEGPDRIVRVALYWQTLTELPQDYTFFVHLTAPDGFVVAQQDQQPFKALWPTTRWTPDNILADRFNISLGDHIQAGDYLLLAGLYNPQTGERLPLLSGPVAPSPDAVLLTPLSLR